MKQHSDFDRIIKEKLDSIRPEFEPGHWDLFEQQLDAEAAGTPEAEEKVIDQSVYAKLHELEAPYDPDSWHVLSRRINHEFHFVKEVLHLKIAEFGLIAFAFFTLLQLLPAPEFPAIEYFPVPGVQQAQLEGQDNPGAVSSTEAARPAAATGAEDAVSNNPGGRVGSPVTEDPGALANSISRLEETKALSFEQSVSSRAEIPYIAHQPYRPPSSPVLTLPLTKSWVESQKAAPSLSEYLRAMDRPDFDYSLAELNPLSSSHFHSLQPLTDRGLDVETMTSWQKGNLRFGMLGSVNYDRINTPPTEVEDGLISLDRYALGYGAGFTLGFEWGRWELETGMIYAAKQYQALPLVYLDGSFDQGYYGEGFKRIELHIINIPLHFRYNFYHHNRWRFYALAGSSLQMAYQTNFFKADQEGFRNHHFNPQPVPPGRGSSESPSGIQDKPRANGLFEGGSFKENSFISANVGLGLEYYMSTRISVFAQPTYEHSVLYLNGGRGFGPYADKINCLYLFGGVKIRLFE